MNVEISGEPRVLVVDDDAIVRGSIGAYLEDSGFSVTEADGGVRGVALFREAPPDLALLDLRMPDMDGLEVLEVLHGEFPEIPVIIVTGAGLLSDAIEALRLGAWDFITKPIGEMAILEHAIRRALERGELMRENRRYREHLEEQVELRTAQLELELAERKRVQEALRHSLDDLRRVTEGTINSLSRVGEMRDPYTAGHQRRVANLAVAIAEALGLAADRVEAVYVAGLLHDIGKISVPIEILTKPGKISDLEFGMIQRHSVVGYEILKEVEFDRPIAEYVRQHHERIDGSGYPDGLIGESIHLEARILAVADVVEAMSSHRPYRPGLGIEDALAEIERHNGVHYDPEVAGACLRLFREQGYTFDSHMG